MASVLLPVGLDSKEEQGPPTTRKSMAGQGREPSVSTQSSYVATYPAPGDGVRRRGLWGG